MARGWESKSVEEAQIESANVHHRKAKALLTPEQAQREKQCDSLLLHRTRVLRDIQNCSDERYRKTLAEGLSYLETQLTALGWR
jgi:hypothetical protein